MAPQDKRLAKYFESKTGKAKAGHIFTVALCLKEVLQQSFTITRTNSLLKSAFAMSGFQMQITDKPSDNCYLHNVFKHNINEPPPGANSNTLRGLNIHHATYEQAKKAGSTPGRKPGKAGLSSLKS